MFLASGTLFGVYKIVAPIGAGGMGEVYRAWDAKLNRAVALKFLPVAFATDSDRLARFSREAQALASFSHPNIGQIYGLEDSGSSPALVLELVEGPTLADRIARGPIPLRDALPIARQIAQALEAAHDQGIVHWDLKPANIKARSDGIVKVLDFGLTKALDPTSSTSATSPDSSTLTHPGGLTNSGAVLGTAAYMSPEQARGQVVDKADRHLGIWVRALRNADGPASVQGSKPVGHDGGYPYRRAGLERAPGRQRHRSRVTATVPGEGREAAVTRYRRRPN